MPACPIRSSSPRGGTPCTAPAILASTPVSHGCVPPVADQRLHPLPARRRTRGWGRPRHRQRPDPAGVFARASRRNRGQRVSSLRGRPVGCSAAAGCTNISGYSWVRRRDRMGVPVMPVRQFTAAVAIASLLIACALLPHAAFAAQRAAKAKPEPRHQSTLARTRWGSPCSPYPWRRGRRAARGVYR